MYYSDVYMYTLTCMLLIITCINRELRKKVSQWKHVEILDNFLFFVTWFSIIDITFFFQKFNKYLLLKERKNKLNLWGHIL